MNTQLIRISATALCTLALLATSHSHAAAGDVGPSVAVKRLVIAKGVDEREPVDAGTEFSLADASHLFAFVEVDNTNLTPTAITIAWVDTTTGKERPPYTLEIGAGHRWRTWMRAVAPKQPGSYEVVAFDESGNELARTSFTMKP